MLDIAKERLQASFSCSNNDIAMVRCLQSIAASLVGILEYLEAVGVSEHLEAVEQCYDKDWDMK